jgi:hypothetical protein
MGLRLKALLGERYKDSQLSTQASLKLSLELCKTLTPYSSCL